MTQNKTISRWQLLPPDLKRMMILIAVLIITSIVFFFLIPSLALFYGPFVLLLLIIEYGIYQLKSWAQKVTTLILAVIAFFSAFRIIEFLLNIIPNLLSFNPYVMVSTLISNLIYPLVVFYLLYLISNDHVKKYFEYPEMIDNRTNVGKNKKVDDRKYKSLSDTLDN